MGYRINIFKTGMLSCGAEPVDLWTRKGVGSWKHFHKQWNISFCFSCVMSLPSSLCCIFLVCQLTAHQEIIISAWNWLSPMCCCATACTANSWAVSSIWSCGYGIFELDSATLDNLLEGTTGCPGFSPLQSLISMTKTTMYFSYTVMYNSVKWSVQQ